jgi:N-acetylmuramoyl-L-alanine amidase
VIQIPSPNHGPRPPGGAVDILLLHYTGMESASAALQRLTAPESGVSAHYLIDEDGQVMALVDEDRRAWHAGLGSWGKSFNINDVSIGIELVNPGHEFGYQPFPAAQMAALIGVAGQILARHPAITPARVLAHSDIAPARKQDPGELFDWRLLAQNGIGFWPQDDAGDLLHCNPQNITTLQKNLAAYGYPILPSGILDDQTRQVVLAFQRHFQPDHLTGTANAETCRRLLSLLRQAGLG